MKLHVCTYICVVILKKHKMRMTRLFFAGMLMMAVAGVQAQPAKSIKTAAQLTKWANDASHSSIKFNVSHLTVSEVEGRFKTFTGTIESPSTDFKDAHVNFTADVTS